VSPDPEINPADPSDREKAARVLAGRRLLPFIKRFRPKYDAGWVHEDICRRLERFVKDVEEGKEPRLLLAMPVRHGKSEIGSRHFAPWVMGKHPDWEIIAASGAQSLAMSFSRYIRDLVRDPAYQSIFPSMKLDPSSQSVENWNTLSGGGYLAAGIGTMITGRGCHILLLDDPVKDAEAADSRVIRDATWEWYMSTAVTRLAPGGGVLGIMTFWHDDDWAGRIQQVMATGDGDKFEIVKYPAINEAGDEYILADDSIVQLPPGSTVPSDARMTRPRNTALHPARYTLEALLRRKANYHALGQQRWWNALYQQNPAAEEGAYFRKEWFQGYGTAPRRIDCTVYQAWDFAITEKALSDYTVGVTIMQDANDNLSVVDVRRFKMGDGDELMRIVVSYAKEFMPDLIGFEDGQIWKALASTFTKTCQENSYYPAYEVLQPLTDKMVRAQPLRGRMQARKIWFDKSAHWYNDLQQEFLRFPTGKHDDMIDSTAWCVRLTLSKSAPKPPAPPVLKGWKDRLGAMMAGADASHMAS
jgi:predicted phage terminase large subunit-like protein